MVLKLSVHLLGGNAAVRRNRDFENSRVETFVNVMIEARESLHDSNQGDHNNKPKSELMRTGTTSLGGKMRIVNREEFGVYPELVQ